MARGNLRRRCRSDHHLRPRARPIRDPARTRGQGQRVNGREIAIQKTASVSKVAGCNILFIASSEQDRLDEILERLGDRPLLTVSDGESGAERGAIIGLTLDDKRVRFEVNLNAARRARLKLSSQLLKVAVRLIGQRDQGQ